MNSVANIAVKLLLVMAINGVVIWGVGWDHWSGATALVLYWCENLLNVAFVTLRILIHRTLTQKEGHYRGQLGATVSGGDDTEPYRFKSFVWEFFISGLIFTLAHGVFVAIMIAIALKTTPDYTAIKWGLIWIAGFKVIDLLIDLVGISRRPFAWIKQVAGLAFGRIVLLHLAIIAGVGLAAFTGYNANFFIPLVCLKLLVEVLGCFGTGKQIKKAPRWLVRLGKWLKPNDDFEKYLADELAKDEAQAARDEQVRDRQTQRKHKRVAPRRR